MIAARGIHYSAALGGGLARPALGECGDVFGQPIDVSPTKFQVCTHRWHPTRE